MGAQEARDRRRADLGFGAAGPDGTGEGAGQGAPLAGFDPAEWTTAAARARPEPDAAARSAGAAGFRPRPTVPPAPPASTASTGAPAPTPAPIRAPSPAPAQDRRPGRHPDRRRRTGRNAQLNLKLRPETIDAFCAVADAHGWGLGETFERALALLEEAERTRG